MRSTAGSIDLAGLLLKTGAYGLIRFGYPLFPEAARTLTPLLVIMAVTGILYGSWIAFAQKDMKRLVAYSSVGHMGFVALGIAAWTPVALSGSILLMVSHGVTTSALFAMVGMLAARTQTREISAYGGLWGKVPVLSCFFMLFAMASAGLPGLNNFVGEFLILIGSYQVQQLATVLAFLGLILSLVYTVRLVQDLAVPGRTTALGDAGSDLPGDPDPDDSGPGCDLHRSSSRTAARYAGYTGGHFDGRSTVTLADIWIALPLLILAFGALADSDQRRHNAQ